MDVVHDAEKQEFCMDVGAYRAVLLYARHEKVLDFYHIYVPDPYRKRRIAYKILTHAFDYARKQGYQIVPTCPFISANFLKRFPQYKEIVRPGEFLFVDSS